MEVIVGAGIDVVILLLLGIIYGLLHRLDHLGFEMKDLKRRLDILESDVRMQRTALSPTLAPQPERNRRTAGTKTS